MDLKTDKNRRYNSLVKYFVEAMPVAVSELSYKNSFELIVAVILSAQCTDKRVNMVTPTLFAKYPSPDAMAVASVDDIFDIIRSISFPNAKAANLLSMARSLVARHSGHVPSTRAELEALAGVGHKTASVVLSVAFGADEIAVDTHVFRVARRIGLVEQSKTVLDTERQLVAGFTAVDPELKIPNLLGTAHHWLILHGRYVCTARKPKCEQCALRHICLSFPMSSSAEKVDRQIKAR